MSTWRERGEHVGNVEDVGASPYWERGVPVCSEGGCHFYDGKRCRVLGMRPSRVCEPVVERMGEMLDSGEGRVTEKEETKP